MTHRAELADMLQEMHDLDLDYGHERACETAAAELRKTCATCESRVAPNFCSWWDDRIPPDGSNFCHRWEAKA